MTDRDDRSLQRETGQENPLGDGEGGEVIDGRHGRHGGSEESEGAPQSPPRKGESNAESSDRNTSPSRDPDAR